MSEAALPRASASRRRWGWTWFWVAPPVLLAALIAGASIGETRIPPEIIFQVLGNKLFDAGYPVGRIDEGIVWNYRLSRAIVAACCGAALALSGVVLQALLRNALADPYLLGISAGASTGAVAVTVAGPGAGAVPRPEERRVGKECGSTFRHGGSRDH